MLCTKDFIVKGRDFNEIFNHMETCEFIIYECGYCDEIMHKSMNQDHFERCSRINFKKCSVCEINYPEKFSKAHKEYFCKILVDLRKLSLDLFK